MRILVYPHDLSIGGSQLNAIELAAAVADLGHEVTVFGVPGPLVTRVLELGLDFVPSPVPRRRPSPAVVRALAQVVHDRNIEVIHGYEWPPALEMYLVTLRTRSEVRGVATVMSMAVASFLPRTVPLLVGTAQIAAVERSSGRQLVGVLEPPVDLEQNNSAAVVDLSGFRMQWGIDHSKCTIVMVTRLAHELKLEGLLTAIDVVDEFITQGRRVQLVIVGDGPARDEIRRRVHDIDRRHGPGMVVLTGELSDPRPAYEAADIVLGMGGSVLRAMAFGKPVVVQGEKGFWKPLDAESIDHFLWAGWYGVGSDSAYGHGSLRSALEPLIDSDSLRSDRGSYAHATVARFSLDAAAQQQLREYESAREQRPTLISQVAAAGRTFVRYGSYALRERWRRVRGIDIADDFNSKPVAASGVQQHELR